MGNFKEMSTEELFDNNGGSLSVAIGLIFAGAAAYGVLREMIKEKGRADAYEDLRRQSSGYHGGGGRSF